MIEIFRIFGRCYRIPSGWDVCRIEGTRLRRQWNRWGESQWRTVIPAGLVIVYLSGCSHAPTAPTPIPVVVNQPPAVVNTPPPVVVTPPTTPVVSTPTPDPLLSDPRFSLSFYRLLALGSLSGPIQPLQRQAQAPFIYLFTVDQAGAAIDAQTLDVAAAALINTAGTLTGRFGLEGMERGTGASSSRPNQITVLWSSDPNTGACGITSGLRAITLYYRTPNCGCNGSAMRPRTVKHELGHALGFWHTGDAQDLMSGLVDSRCDQSPSDREIFHARIAYQMPIGSLDPK